MSIGNKIRQRREYLNWSQDELAKRMGYKSRSTINKIEKGINDITQSKIMAFSKVLGVSIDYLMDDDENRAFESNAEFATEFDIDRKKIWLEATHGQSLNDDEFFKLIEYLKFIVSQRKKD